MRILIWGAHPHSNSGAGKICALMAGALRENHSVMIVAYDGVALGPTVVGRKERPIRVLCYLDSLVGETMSAVSECDLVITIGDLWNHQPIHECVARYAKPWVAYVGCEGANYPKVAKLGENTLRIDKLTELISCFWAFTKNTTIALERDFPGIPVEVLPHAVDVQAIRSAPQFPLRELLGISDKPLWLFVGFNNIRKGIDIFLRQIELHKVVAYIHSDNFYPTGWDLVEARRSLGLEGVLFLKSDLDKKMQRTTYADTEIYGIYKEAALFLHPHRAEGFGLCVLEALCAGVPVLATDCAGPATYLPKHCKIPTWGATLFRNNGGVGYKMWEPQMPTLKPRKHFKPSGFDPRGYDIPDFVRNVNRLIGIEYETKLWMRAS